MNKIEFKALVKGLFLTQEQVRQIGGYKDQRQIRRFFSGEQRPHKDLIAKLLKIDREIDEAVIYSANKAIECAVEVVSVVGYKDQQQLDDWGDDSILLFELHLCLVFRLSKALHKLGVKLNVVPFNVDSYLDFINTNDLADNTVSKSAWAASQ